MRLAGVSALFLALSALHAQDRLAITGVTVVDVAAATLRSNQTVLIEGNLITAVSAREVLPRNTRHIDGRGKFLIPGLWDMHVHDSADARVAQSFLAHGITGVRDMHGPFAAAHQPGPRRVAAGPLLTGVEPREHAVLVRNAKEAQEAVRRHIRSGADFIKVSNELTREAWNAIAAECRRAGVPFAGHTADCVSTTQAAAAGQRSIEHLDGVLLDASSRSTLFRQARRFTPDGAMLESFDPTRARQMYAVYVQYGTWHCPTLVVHRGLYPQPIQTKLREITGDMYRAGVRLLAGSDTGAFGIEPGPGLHTELELLVSAGIPPAAVLRIATLGAAEYLNRQLELGTIAPGKLADLVLLDANPLQSISATRTVRAVIANGVLYDRPALDRLVH